MIKDSRSFVSDIVTRNEDVRPVLDAACRYGHHYFGVPNKDKQFALLITADIHGDKDRLASAIKYMNEVPSIDAGIILGDIAPSNFKNPHEWYYECVAQAAKPWYTVIGNHDGGNSADAEISATVRQQFDRWIKPTLPKIGDISITEPYYSVRNDRYKVELIILDSQDCPDDRDENGNFLVHRGAAAFSQAQIDWLTAELSSVPPDYTVLAALHCIYGGVTAEKCGWSNPEADYSKPEGNCYNGLIPSVFDAWIKGAKLTGEFKSPSSDGLYDKYLPVINVNADFTQRGPGLFAGYIAGHTHIDAAGYITDYPDQKYYSVNTTAADYWQSGSSDLARCEGTKAEDCVTVAVIDTARRQVKLVRIGASFTMDMETRLFHIGNY